MTYLNEKGTTLEPTPSHKLLKRLQSRVTIGLLVISSIIGGISTTLLYRSHAEQLETTLLLQMEQQATILQSEIIRLKNLTTQITSRTRIRQELEKYLLGHISLKTLVDFSRPKLIDAMRLAPDMTGISRLDKDGHLLVQAGAPVPRETWPEKYDADDVQLGIPQAINEQNIVVLSAPIYNPDGRKLGIDLVSFDIQHFIEHLQNFVKHYGGSGHIQLVHAMASNARKIFGSDESIDEGTRELLDKELSRAITTEAAAIHRLTNEKHDIIIAYQAIGDSGWIYLYFDDTDNFFRSATLHAAYVAISILILSLIGISLILLLIRPLSRRIASETSIMHRLFNEHDDLLNKIRLSEQRFELAMLASNDGIWDWDLTSGKIYYSPRWKSMLGYDEDELQDDLSSWKALMHDEDRDKTMSLIDACVDGEHNGFSNEQRMRHKDGHWVTTLVQGLLVCDDDGKPDRFVGIQADISERSRTQKALLDSEMHLREERDFINAVVDAAGSVIVVLDNCGNVVRFNQAAESITGFSFGELEGRPIWNHLIPPEIREEIKVIFDNLTANNIIERYENEWMMKDGSRRLFDWRNTVLNNDDGQITHIVAQGYDITDIRKTQQALAEHRNKLESLVAERTAELEDTMTYNRTLFETSPVGLALSDMDGKLVDVNPAYLHIIGYSADEIRDIREKDITPVEYQEQEALQRQSLEHIGDYGPYNKEYIHKDGHRITVRLSGRIIERGGKKYIWSSVEDITDQQRTERELKHFKSTLDRTQDCVFMFIPDSLKIHYVNQGAVDLVGFEHDELVKMKAHDLIPGVDEVKFRALITAILQGDSTSITFETLYRHKNGEDIPVELFIQYITPDDEPATFISIVRDISSHKSTERLLTEAKQRAETAAQAKSEFLANMSHEIRTPLNAVLGLARMGKRNLSPEKNQELFDMISDSGQRLVNVVNDILDFSKIEAGKLTLDEQPFDLINSVRHVISLVKQQVEDKGLQLTLKLDDGLPGWVTGDSLRLQQILINLLSNAIKFTEQGGIVVSVSNHPDQVRFIVSDTGIGISEEKMSHLFTPFEQADSSTTRLYGGTGLGLSICQSLAALMDGQIEVTSESGKGTDFILTLPLTPTSPVVEADTRLSSGKQHLKGINILVAEDLEVNRLVLDDMLTSEGAITTFAHNGKQAIEMITDGSTRSYDVVLMDIQMPVMDGHEATQLIHVIAPELPVIGLTAHALAEEKKRCFASGMVAHVAKPVDPDELIITIQQHLSTDVSHELMAVQENERHGNHIVSLPASLQTIDIIDWTALQRRYSGNNATVNKILTSFINNHSETPEKLRDAVLHEDTTMVRSLAHGLKGVLGYIEASALMDLAEQAQSDEDDDAVDKLQLGAQLADSIDILLDTLSDIID